VDHYTGAVEYEYEACHECEGTGRVPYHPRDATRLLAFLGVEEAREIVPEEEWYASAQAAGGPRYSVWTIKEWSETCATLLAKLPPHRLEVHAATCPGNGSAIDRDVGTCSEHCPVHHDTPASQWLVSDATLAVARECLLLWEDRQGWTWESDGYRSIAHRNVGHTGALPPRAAIAAGQAWVAEPTQDRERVWQERVAPVLDLPRWVPNPTWSIRGIRLPDRQPLQAASEILGEPRVREIVARAIVGRVL